MIVVGTTIAPFKAVSNEHLDWLLNAQDMIKETPHELAFFAALEIDSRGKSVYDDLFVEGAALVMGGAKFDYWTFSMDDHVKEIDGTTRLARICTGRNLVHEYAQRNSKVTHILFLDSDLKVPGDSINKLLEIGTPLCGGDVPAYCMNGAVDSAYDFPVELHWNTAGFLMINSDVFKRLRWRSDIQAGSTDDPCFQQDAKTAGFGETRVRKDLVGLHRPLTSLENRGHDLKVYR